MKKYIKNFLLLIFILITLTSCTQSQSTNENSIILYVGTEIFDNTLDPVKGGMSYGYPFINSALLKVSPSSEYVGDIATNWTVSDDALVYTFNLREDIKFGDGSIMTADDVVFTYITVQENQAQNENIDLTLLKSVESVGDNQVVFTLSKPYSPFLDITSMLGIVPKDYYDSDSFNQNPIGSGPWKVLQYDSNQQIILAPNEYYYDGVPSIDRVTLVALDGQTSLSAAHSGDLDVVMVGSDYATQSVEGMTMIPLETIDIRMISLPMISRQTVDGKVIGNNVTSDINVRCALSVGIDRDKIIENSLNGIGKPAFGFTDNLVWANSENYTDGQIDKAIDILEKSGWIDIDGDGIREKDGIKCEFDLFAAEDRYPLIAALAENAFDLGIKINAHSSNWNEISDKMQSESVLWGWGQFSPTVLPSLFDSKKIDTGGYDNVVSYSNIQIDELIDKALDSSDFNDAMDYWKEVQVESQKDLPYIYLVNIEHSYFINDNLDISFSTQIPHPHGHGSPILCNLKDWTIKGVQH